MASDGVPVNPPVSSLVQGSQAVASITVPEATGKILPKPGKPLPSKAAPPPELDLQALLARLNKNLNDSGKPIQFRLASSSGSKVIQQINPSSGEVVGEYSVSEFPALAQGLGVPGLVIDSHA
jgi:hypothetical protein